MNTKSNAKFWSRSLFAQMGGLLERHVAIAVGMAKLAMFIRERLE